MSIMIARISRLAGPPEAGRDWNQSPWNAIESLLLSHHMGARPVHFPETRVKVACDHAALYVMFLVKDRYVRASAARHQDSVCKDSCVEFFFTPVPDPSTGYFNIEVNCGGTMLFHYHEGANPQPIEIPVSDCARMIRSHSLPRMVDPEVRTPLTWTVEYAVPFALLGRYAEVDPPLPGAVWRANFYKCADETSHPHWLTWAKVDYPQPNFHLPRCFGTLIFE